MARDRVEYSYGVSYYFSRLYDTATPAPGASRPPPAPRSRSSEVVRPEEKVYMANSAGASRAMTPYPWLYINSIQFRHINGVNIGFADGHARWFPKNSKYGDLLGADGSAAGGRRHLVRAEQQSAG